LSHRRENKICHTDAKPKLVTQTESQICHTDAKIEEPRCRQRSARCCHRQRRLEQEALPGRVNGRSNRPIRRNNRDLVWHGERRTKEVLEDGAAMTGQEKEKRRTNDWRTYNEKRIDQAKTGLFIQNLCETEHPGDYEHVGILILEFRRELGRLYEMAPVRIGSMSLRKPARHDVSLFHQLLKTIIIIRHTC